MKLVVGLGNPGEYYKQTRHNIGFMIVERVARESSIQFSRKKFKSTIGEGTIVEQRIIVAKPLTYMNLCGDAIKKLATYFKTDPKALIVVHDDLDIEFGKIKIKEKGGHGGHNGVRSIIATLGTNDFLRLKVGIGRPAKNQGVRDYVLSSFDSDQLDFLPDLICMAGEAIVSVITHGAQAAMNEFNRKSCNN